MENKKPKAEFAVIFADRKLRDKLSEIILPINPKECKNEADVLTLISSLKFHTSYLFVTPKLMTEPDKVIGYLKEHPEKSKDLAIIVMKEADADDSVFQKSYGEIPDIILKIADKSTMNNSVIKELIKSIKLERNDRNEAKNEDENDKNSNSKMKEFKFIEKLGEGQEGVVYKVENRKEGRISALKSMSLSNFDDKTISEMRAKDQHFIEAINCPNIIKFYQAFEEDNKRYIEMEIAQGGMLSDFLRNMRITGESLSVDVLLRWTCDMLIALKYLNTLNICHRDIKPDNIILCMHPVLKSNDKDKMTCKLIDLGVAKVIEAIGVHTEIGTLFYVAPEVISGGNYDSSIDLWSFAVVLYELVMREKPFNDPEALNLKELILKKNCHEKLPDSVDPRIKYVISRLLRKNPKRRLNIDEILSMDFIKEQIEKILKDLPEFENKYPIYKEILALPTIVCPYTTSLISNDDYEHLNLCGKILDNASRKAYKKSLFGGKMENTFLGSELLLFMEDIITGKDAEDQITDKLNQLVKKELLICVSKNEKEEFLEKEYYIVCFDSFGQNIDNPLLGTITPKYKNTSLLKLTESLLYKGMKIISSLYNDSDDETEEISFSSSKLSSTLIEFIFGLSQFNDFKLLELNKRSKDEKNATLLNLYQIMFIHNILKLRLDMKAKKNFLLSFVKNDVSINYKFADTTINNLELRFGVFRENKKPLENYLKILSGSDPRLELAKGIKIGFADLLITPVMLNPELFDNKKFLFRIFDEKEIEFQKNQYISDFASEIIEITDESYQMPITYEKYFEFDFNQDKGFFSSLVKSLSYNNKLGDDVCCIYKNVVKDEIKEEYSNFSKINNKLKDGSMRVEFI